MWEQDITIYHKTENGYTRYIKKASVRNTSILNRNNTGVSSTDRAIIRVFDILGYKDTWNIEKNDIIVNKAVNNDILNAPMTELRKLYGENNVYQVKSIDEFLFNDIELPNHIKIGAI